MDNTIKTWLFDILKAIEEIKIHPSVGKHVA